MNSSQPVFDQACTCSMSALASVMSHCSPPASSAPRERWWGSSGRTRRSPRPPRGPRRWAATNVRFVAGDIRDTLFDERFDAVVGRFVLMYLADPTEALEAAVGAVRHGGLVVFQEWHAIDPFMSTPTVELWDRTGALLVSTFGAAGTNLTMGLELRACSKQPACPDPTCELNAWWAVVTRSADTASLRTSSGPSRRPSSTPARAGRRSGRAPSQSRFWARTVSDLRLSAPRSPHETDRAQIDGTTTRRSVAATSPSRHGRSTSRRWDQQGPLARSVCRPQVRMPLSRALRGHGRRRAGSPVPTMCPC